ncbi:MULTISPECIES: Na(+)/H(+) antiporter subunit F1 [Paenisporosarcina]|jgi:multicomponent Na+:H+ antiporter subunit F|uniref:Na(+)/H(+) antiporter subunit F1 n=1 Tax=Paenisporosarcina quisquiliarum TaxID=365346 RepID=A0A9X3LJ25_9BACL|nr:Na(+)/H(+) antiporter subunit F1 [Paenisporosarcina quisquiliarum]MCZ8537399.1 Na(+)/H(+) antiporter subunit F1 [Paenisporosarcina quisquiliarum]
MMVFFWVMVILISLSMLAFIYRLIVGPSIPDRVVALDSLGVALICMIGLFSILVDTSFFLEIILLLAILAFIGTVAFSKFLEKGEIIQRDNDHS